MNACAENKFIEKKYEGSASYLDYDFSTIDWTMKKSDLVMALQGIEYTEWSFGDLRSIIIFDAYMFNIKATFFFEFRTNELLDSVTANISDDNDFSLSPTYTIAVLSNGLGIPGYVDDSYGEDSGYSFCLWHCAVWFSNPSAIVTYSSDDELYYEVDSDSNSVRFDSMLYDPNISFYKWEQLDEVMEYYGIKQMP